MKAKTKLKVGVIGQGYVGLPISMAAAGAGYKVLGFDVNTKLVSELNAGKSHISDVFEIEIRSFLQNGNYRASSDIQDLSDLDIAVIAVPTPLNGNRKPELKYVEEVSKILGKALKKQCLIINESTSYPGTLRNLIAPLIRELDLEGLNHEFSISPERVDPGNKKWNIRNTPRLFSGLTPNATEKTRKFYEKFCDTLIEVSTPEIAEMAKLFENTFRQVNIALVNELALITRDLGISVHETIEAASTKPYGFMKFLPGLGVGGHCIPVDPSYLSHIAELSGRNANFINLANKVNLEMPAEIVKRVKVENGQDLNDKKVVICGVAYKPNISDFRESPSNVLYKELLREGAIVSWHDPLVDEWNGTKSSQLVNDKFDICIVAVFHEAMDKLIVMNSAPYIFDCTNKLKGAVQL